MGMKDWAAMEVEIACKREAPDRKDGEWDYGCACYESALKAYNSLAEDEHSGMSWNITKRILMRLMDGKILTPIEDVPEVWNEITYDKDGGKKYQCKRMSSLFKDVDPDGTVHYYDVDRVGIFDIISRTSWHSGFVSHIIHEMYPITMPYIPEDRAYIVDVEQLLTDRKNGDFDTEALLFVTLPDGKRVDLNRYFGETEDGWKEISEEEYNSRKILHTERELKEARVTMHDFS